ncbi:MAG TPA: hypothetical protein ENJ82_14050, partial [Bacteroidetes bacterium]|nr:hypothetical protein [Bacteroidota bacterium]
LVATDVAARGVDIADLTHVINFNLPDEAAVYIHRSGRTGRAGKAGVSIALLSEEEVEKIQTLEKLAGKEFSSGTLEEVPEPRKQREPQAENDEGSPKEKPNKKSVERKPANREAGARQSPRNQRDDRNGNGRERPARDAVAPRENGRGRSGQGDVSGENERSRGRQDVKSERRSRGRDQQVDSQRDSRGRGRDQQEDSQRDSRGRGRDQQEDSQRDSRGRGRSRHSEAERNDGRRNSRDGRNGSQGRQNNDGRDSQTPQGEPLRRKTERAYDSVPVAMDSPASRRRSGGKKMPTPNEVKALIKAIKKANPNKKHLQKLMPAMLEQLDKYTWEEVIGKFVAYLDERGMLDEEKPKEKEAQPTGLKALFSSWRR